MKSNIKRTQKRKSRGADTSVKLEKEIYHPFRDHCEAQGIRATWKVQKLVEQYMAEVMHGKVS